MDLDAYLTRIGYTGVRTATMQALQSIVRCHAETIPFENLNPLLRLPVNLDIASLEKKLVQDGRGGYCFEHNLLLKHALQEIGFPTIGLAARALWKMPIDSITARSHMLLQVDVEGHPHIVDVGFGGVTLTGVLKLVSEVEQVTPHEKFRLMPIADGFFMQVCIHEEWITLYRFDLSEQFLPDYEVASWYLSHHPESLFVNHLLAARTVSDRRYALRNNEFATHKLHGETTRRTISDCGELRAILQETFLITLPNVQELDETLQRLCQAEP